jgi:hypothetical protein
MLHLPLIRHEALLRHFGRSEAAKAVGKAVYDRIRRQPMVLPVIVEG